MFGIGSIDNFEKSLVKDKRNKLDKRSAKRYVKDFLKASKSGDIKTEMSKLNKKYEQYFSDNLCFLADFSEKKKSEKPNRYVIGGLGAVGVLGGANTVRHSINQGIPRALGVRLESHSTSKKNAESILKNGGYLDPNRMGEKAASVQKYDKKYSFITGAHPDSKVIGLDRLYAPNLQTQYRAMGSMDKDVMQRVLRSSYAHEKLDLIKKVKDGLDWEQTKEITRNANNLFGTNYQSLSELLGDSQKLKSIHPKNPLDAEQYKKALKNNTRTGKTLWVGGSDDFYKLNFKPDEDMPKLAMKTSEKIKVKGSRFGAVKDAIKREGLINLVKKHPGRVATGLGVLAVGTAFGVTGVKRGVKHLRYGLTGDEKHLQQNKKKGK
jgi:hypothetical protein